MILFTTTPDRINHLRVALSSFRRRHRGFAVVVAAYGSQEAVQDVCDEQMSGYLAVRHRTGDLITDALLMLPPSKDEVTVASDGCIFFGDISELMNSPVGDVAAIAANRHYSVPEPLLGLSLASVERLKDKLLGADQLLNPNLTKVNLKWFRHNAGKKPFSETLQSFQSATREMDEGLLYSEPFTRAHIGVGNCNEYIQLSDQAKVLCFNTIDYAEPVKWDGSIYHIPYQKIVKEARIAACDPEFIQAIEPGAKLMERLIKLSMIRMKYR